ncbi:MAG: 3'-5' exonuclease, partial [Janthinobacterium lividum]
APQRNAGLVSAPQLLANELAAWIAGQIATARLESKGRRLVAGDVLVLVRRRNDFARALVRALKTRGVAVAGLDRLVLTDQPAVQDLMALGDALLLPEDDLTLACVLTSPLGGVSDDSLMRLAAERRGSLWRALRERAAEQDDWAAAWAFLSTLAARADFAGPHALLAEALGPLGGRARLFARLGPEAAEPVDELLGAALAYGRAHPPSLQGFLHWLRQSGAEVKRQAEEAGDAVRIMTVHGAKGLQAPLVILPDTTSMPPDDGALAWTHDPVEGIALPLWAPRKEFGCTALQKVRDDGAAARTAEYNRLLYVALTRAEDRLVVCGWQGRREVDAACWYRLVEQGMQALHAAPAPFPAWGGEALVHDSPQRAAVPVPRGDEAAGSNPPPAWLGRAPDWRPDAPPPEPSLPRPLAPSRPEGVAFGPTPRAASPLRESAPGGDRFRRGTLMHTLLQHLPALPPHAREAAALHHVSGAAQDLPPAEAAALVREALAVLGTPALAALFGPGSVAEQPLTGLVGSLVVTGRIDRMLVRENEILVADFKTGHDAPPDVADTPVPYLRQMAAYRAILRLIWDARPVVCALVWTRGPTVAVLPDWLLDRHVPEG